MKTTQLSVFGAGCIKGVAFTRWHFLVVLLAFWIVFLEPL